MLKLLPASRRVNGGFYWYYQLRGNDVMHDPFDDLGKDFPAERASLNIQGTKGSLSRFIMSEINPIEVHLCHEDQSLATAIVDFGAAFDAAFAKCDIEREACRLPATYALNPSPAFGGEKGALLTCVVSIRGENVAQTPVQSLSENVGCPAPPAGGMPRPRVPNDYDTDHGIEDIERADESPGPSTTDTHLVVPPVPNHFSMSIDILSVQMISLHKPRIGNGTIHILHSFQNPWLASFEFTNQNINFCITFYTHSSVVIGQFKRCEPTISNFIIVLFTARAVSQIPVPSVPSMSAITIPFLARRNRFIPALRCRSARRTKKSSFPSLFASLTFPASRPI